MDIGKLENGSYTQYENGPTSPASPVIPSSVTSGAVLFAENELFDQVAYEKEVSKKKQKVTSFKATNGCTSSCREEYDYPRRGSIEELEPAAGSATYCNKETKGWCFNVTVVVILLTIIGLFTLPLIFYYVDVPENDDFSQSEADNIVELVEHCITSGNSTGTGMMTNRMMVTTGECYNYTGVCLDHLKITAMLYHTPTTNDSVKVMNNPRVTDPDSLVNLFTSFAPDNCERDGLPLLCNYFYLVCNSSGDSPVVLSDLEEKCIEVSQGTCRTIWELGRDGNIVPDCNDLDSGGPVLTVPTSNITCHPQFGLRCGLCVPLCKEFSETPEDIQKSIDLLFVIAGSVIVLGGVFVILVSIIRRNVMFDFPSVLIVYMTIVTMVLGLLLLIGYGARDHLYCTVPELPIAYDNPTTFCQLSGFLVHAGVVQMMLYWLLHLIHLFLKFVFPFSIRRIDTKQWKRGFHVGEVILVNVVTSIAPICVLTASKYYPYGYPPNLCIPNASLTFYTILVPITIILCVGTCLILLMFWRLQLRTESIVRTNLKVLNFMKLTTPEVKMLALLCFFLVFGISNMIYFSLYARNYEFLISLATEYAVCHAYGRNDSCEVHKDEIQDYRYHGLANTCYFLMAFLTISNLLFAVHVKQLKGQIRRLSVKATRTIRSFSVRETQTNATSKQPSDESCKKSSADS